LPRHAPKPPRVIPNYRLRYRFLSAITRDKLSQENLLLPVALDNSVLCIEKSPLALEDAVREQAEGNSAIVIANDEKKALSVPYYNAMDSLQR